MKVVHHGICRLMLHLARVLLVPLELISPRAYMKIYVRLLRSQGLRLTGMPRYISSRARFDDFKLISLGERTVVSKYVTFLTHDYSVTTALVALDETPATDIAIYRNIAVGDNVFVGMGALLLPGAKIGDNVIVGAGSIVKGTVPSDSVVAGNPAKVIGSLSGQADKWLNMANCLDAHQDKS